MPANFPSKVSAISFACLFSALVPAQDPAPNPPLSDETQACIECHLQVSPGIVEDWRRSRHARMTVTEAQSRPTLERRVSADAVPESLQKVAVGCYECHGLNAERHKDNFEHFGIQVNVVVTPDDCKICHPTEAGQFAGSKKAFAHVNLRDNSSYRSLVEATLASKTYEGGRLVHGRVSPNAEDEACLGCHGSEVKVRGMKTVTGLNGQKAEVPDLEGWPNQGVGRINPDGSKGSCSACHARHEFSIEVARKPHTCSQCHQGPDLPAWEVYKESKHGNIFHSQEARWNWTNVPWVPGRDFQAPTCATCHASLLATTDGKVIAQRSHDFGSRLHVRIFGLPYSHPQPISGNTTTIRNADGQPLPVTLGGELAKPHLIDAAEQSRRRAAMGNVCLACHGNTWVDGHFAQLDRTIAETDAMVRTTTTMMRRAWDLGLADRANPFDEPVERKWVASWLFYANSIRYASAMSGPDYAAFEHGWWNLNETVHELDRILRAAAPAPAEKK